MRKRRFKDALFYGANLLVVFLIVATKYDVKVASFAVGCFVVGSLNVFGLMHLALRIHRQEPVSRMLYVAAVCAVLGSAALVLWGHVWPLFLVTACLLFIDAVVLKFK
jgi:hypothetical protein